MILSNVLDFILKPLIQFLEVDTDGEALYQYMYFTRSGVEGKVEAALVGRHNIVIVGNPGSGKTSLMHYMFIDFKKTDKYYPIILDFRNIAVRKPEAILVTFCVEMRRYFDVIGRPLTALTDSSILSNCEDHAMQIQQHLKAVPSIVIDKKRVVIFLDDLDYAGSEYIKILSDYFMPYMHTDKASVILSVRPTLYNSILTHDPLRQYYYVFPREIRLPDDDLEFIIHNRIKSIIKDPGELNEGSNIIDKFLKMFKKKSYDDLIIELIRKIEPDFNEIDFRLPFDKLFYARLSDITYLNIRIVEEVLPGFIEEEVKNPGSSESKFYEIFLQRNFNKEHIIPDLVSEKTHHVKPKLNGNSILQNVLEYLDFEHVINERFYEALIKFGITKEQADRAIRTLSNTPYNMLDAKYLYEKDVLDETEVTRVYHTNIKGKKFIENILTNELYYKLKGLPGSERSIYKERKGFNSVL